MKKQLLFTTMLLITSIVSFGQSFKLDATGANDMRLRTSATDRLTILSTSGNVGIGTVTPQAKLDVTGDFSLSKRTQITAGGATYSAFDRQGASVISFDTGISGTTIINGIAVATPGLILHIVNIRGTLTINHLSTSSYSFNTQINTNTGGPLTISGSGGVTLIWTNFAWYVIGVAN